MDSASNWHDHDSIAVVLRDLPGNAKAFSVPNGDGYLVVINAAMNSTAQRAAYLHELEHIRHGDHHNADYVEYSDEVSDPAPRTPAYEQRIIAWLTMREQAMQRAEERFGIPPFHPIWERLWEYWSFRKDKDIHLIINPEVDGFAWAYFKRMADYIFRPWVEQTRTKEKKR